MKKKEKSMMEVTKDYKTFIKKKKLNSEGKISFDKTIKKAAISKQKQRGSK